MGPFEGKLEVEGKVEVGWLTDVVENRRQLAQRSEHELQPSRTADNVSTLEEEKGRRLDISSLGS